MAKNSGLSDSVSHLLHRAQQFAAERYTQLTEGMSDALTLRQVAVLRALDDKESRTQTDLVNLTGIDRSTLADMVARMEAKGLVSRTKSATDARANSVKLAAKGKSALSAVAGKVARADAAVMDAIPASKRSAFMDVLGALAAAAEAAAPAAPKAKPAAKTAPAKAKPAAKAKAAPKKAAAKAKPGRKAKK
jgi:DNA-binding MarR family transcriptional regulator